MYQLFIIYNQDILLRSVCMAEKIAFSIFRSHRENMSLKCIPRKPHFYLEKLGFPGQNIHCGYSLEPRGGSNVYSQCMF